MSQKLDKKKWGREKGEEGERDYLFESQYTFRPYHIQYLHPPSLFCPISWSNIFVIWSLAEVMAATGFFSHSTSNFQ